MCFNDVYNWWSDGLENLWRWHFSQIELTTPCARVKIAFATPI
jgi:hypothetical protein